MNTKKISISANVLFGKPRIKGTRIAIEQILACLSEGWTYKKICTELEISEDDIKACIAFTYNSVSRTHFIETSNNVYV